jgi:hypothetical protein
MERVKDAKWDDVRRLAAFKVKDAASFEEMRQHILTTYLGIQVKHSYVLDRQTYDCIGIEQQPSLRLRGSKAASPPPSAASPAVSREGVTQDGATSRGGAAAELPAQSQQLQPGKGADSFGNIAACDEGQIPMRRITLQDLARFRTLRDYFAKSPGSQEPTN